MLSLYHLIIKLRTKILIQRFGTSNPIELPSVRWQVNWGSLLDFRFALRHWSIKQLYLFQLFDLSLYILMLIDSPVNLESVILHNAVKVIHGFKVKRDEVLILVYYGLVWWKRGIAWVLLVNRGCHSKVSVNIIGIILFFFFIFVLNCVNFARSFQEFTYVFLVGLFSNNFIVTLSRTLNVSILPLVIIVSPEVIWLKRNQFACFVQNVVISNDVKTHVFGVLTKVDWGVFHAFLTTRVGWNLALVPKHSFSLFFFFLVDRVEHAAFLVWVEEQSKMCIWNLNLISIQTLFWVKQILT